MAIFIAIKFLSRAFLLAAIASTFLFTTLTFSAPPANFVIEDILTGIEQPIGLRFLPDGRMMVIQKKGLIRVVDLSGTTNQVEVYMNLAGSSHLDGINSDQERGLLDIAIDPAFPSSPYIYLFYTPATGPNGAKSRIARFTHTENSGGVTSRGDLSTELILWQDTDGYDSCCHYGGGLDFGPDGKLWLTTGDHFQGSYAGSLQKAGGSVIRINKNGTIPSDNPFVDGNGPNVDSIFAYGLRNPFRARWDIPSGRLLIAEVGGNEQAVAWEDLHAIQYNQETGRFVDSDFGTPADDGVYNGINFGWPQCEGLPPHTNFAGCNIDQVGEPIFGYRHNGITAAINGGLIYRGSQFPAQYQGAYFYADSTRDFIRYLKFNTDGTVAPNPTPDPLSEQNPDSTSFPFDLAPTGRIVYLDVGPDGALYYVSFTDSGGAYGQPNPFVLGAVRRYVFDGTNNRPNIREFTAIPSSGPSPLSIDFTIRAEDLENDPMNYVLFYGDGNSTGPHALPQNTPTVITYTYETDGKYEAHIEVSDGAKTASETIDVMVGTPPIITMLGSFNPRQGSQTNMFRFGDVITFSATATDEEDGPLTGANFLWSISFVRPGNTHPAFGPTTNTSSVDFPIPAQGQGFSGPVYYKCFLTVTDSSGLSTSASIDIFPEKADILFESVPSGILVQINGNTAKQTPFVLDTLINYDHVITVANIECLSDTQYQFANWSNGEVAPQITYIVPETNSTLSSTFSTIGPCPLSLPSSGLAMHLKADAGLVLDGANVISWKDQSGNNNHLNAVGNPVLIEDALHGYGAVHFDGVDDALGRAGFTALTTGGGNRSVFMVARYNSANPNGSAWAGFTYGTASNNKVFGLALTPTGVLGVQGWGTANDISSSPATSGIDGWLYHGAVLNNNTLNQFKNFSPIGTTTHSFATGTGAIRLGEEINGGKNLNMDVAEVVAYNRALTDVEREQVQQYFEQKYALNNAPPEIIEFTSAPETGNPPLEVTFQLQANDLNGDQMSYVVHFGDGASTSPPQQLENSNTVVVSHIYENSGSYEARLELTDGVSSVSRTNRITVGSEPTITTLGSYNPREGASTNSFRFGDTIIFSGIANDPEDGTLDGSNFSWTIDFIRPGSSTPVYGPSTNTASISFPIPSQTEGFGGSVFYRCTLQAIDSDGRSTSQSLDIFPEKVDVLVDTSPSGIAIQLDGSAPTPTPFVIDTLVNYNHTLSAPPEICVSEVNNQFTAWSSGSISPTITFVAPETNSAITATYIGAGSCGPTLPQEGLVMHLKPEEGIIQNGDTVTRWEDQSPSGNHLSAIGAPGILTAGLSNFDVIHFDGFDDALARTGFVSLPINNDSRSVFMFVRYNAVNLNGAGWAGFAYGTTSNNKVFGLALTPTGKLGVQGWGTGNDVLSNPATDGVGRWFSQGAIHNLGILTQYKNRDLIGTATKNFATGTASIRLGEELNAGKNLNMDVAEIIVYNRALSEAERNKVQDYFDAKYSSSGPTVSITSPANAAQFTTLESSITFSATAADTEDGDLSPTIAWVSDLDGFLGTGAFLSLSNLSLGTHSIKAIAQDSDLVAATNTVKITITSGMAIQPVETISLFDGNSLAGLYPWFQSSGFSDPRSVFNAENGMIHVSGDGWGALTTQHRYHNYVMLLEFKWGPRTWSNRIGKAKDAGLLFHSNGAHGGYNDLLIPSFQAQLMEGSMGDVILLKGEDGNGSLLPISFNSSTEQVTCLNNTWNCRGGYRWNPVEVSHTFESLDDTVHWFGWDPQWTDTTGFRGALDLESPDGQWNQLVIVAEGDSAEVFFNGTKVNEITNLSSTEGKLQLEVEFTEFYVRRWELAPLGVSIPPIIPIETLPSGMIGTNYSQMIPTKGGTGAIEWILADGSLPSGLTLDSQTGLLSGNPGVAGMFTFRVNATDAVGSTASQIFELLISPGNTGLVTGGLVLQLEADLNVALQTEYTVAAWLDQSGLGNDLVATGNPQLVHGLTPSGQTAITLDGNDKFERIHLNDPLGGLPSANGNRSVFLVSKYNSSTAWAGLAYGNGANNQAFGILVKHPSGELVLHGWGKGNDLVTSAPGTGAGWLLQSVVLQEGSATIFVGGTQIAQWTHNYNTVLSKLVIGEEIKNLGSVAMDVAAVLIYDRALSAAERQDVEAYLYHKYLEPPLLNASVLTSEVPAFSNFSRLGTSPELKISQSNEKILIEVSESSERGEYHLHAVQNLNQENLSDAGNRLATTTRELSGETNSIVFEISPENDRLFFQVIFEPAE